MNHSGNLCTETWFIFALMMGAAWAVRHGLRPGAAAITVSLVLVVMAGLGLESSVPILQDNLVNIGMPCIVFLWVLSLWQGAVGRNLFSGRFLTRLKGNQHKDANLEASVLAFEFLRACHVCSPVVLCSAFVWMQMHDLDRLQMTMGVVALWPAIVCALMVCVLSRVSLKEVDAFEWEQCQLFDRDKRDEGDEVSPENEIPDFSVTRSDFFGLPLALLATYLWDDMLKGAFVCLLLAMILLFGRFWRSLFYALQADQPLMFAGAMVFASTIRLLGPAANPLVFQSAAISLGPIWMVAILLPAMLSWISRRYECGVVFCLVIAGHLSLLALPAALCASVAGAALGMRGRHSLLLQSLFIPAILLVLWA